MSLLLSLTRVLPPGVVRWVAVQQHRHPRLKALYRRVARGAKTSDGVIPSGPGAGLRFRTGHGTLGFLLGTMEPQIQALLPAICAPGQTVYDVGGNIGFFTVVLARLVGVEGRVIAFEPVPDNFRVLAHNVTLNGFRNVKMIPQAVSDGPATLRMGTGGYDSTYAVAPATVSSGEAGETGSVAVTAVSLDGFVLEKGNPPPDLVKIDVEGHEVQVLGGMRRLVREHGPLILCEVHGTNERVSALFHEFGYWQAVIEEPGRALAEAHWNAHVLAGPPSKRFLLDRLPR